MYNYDLSIIIPTYNVEGYIVDTLNSVLNQESNFTYEVLIIDDQSTDNTINVINNFLDKTDNIKIFSQNNGGAGKARNKGINESSGEYILFVDSDDILSENAIETLMRVSKVEDLDQLLFSGKAFLDKSYNKTDFFPNYERSSFEIQDGQSMFLSLFDKKQFYHPPYLYITKSTIFKKNNLFFPEGIIFEDAYISFYSLILSERCMSIKDVLYKRRIREGSVMTGKKARFAFISSAGVHEKMIQDLNKYPFLIKKVKRKINFHMFRSAISNFYKNDNKKDLLSLYYNTKNNYCEIGNKVFADIWCTGFRFKHFLKRKLHK